jgi:hypothetical protein
MNVFVLMGEIAYEGGTVLGVYSSREAARSAALAFDAANRASQYPTGYDYYIHEVGVDVAAEEHIGFDGEFIEVE